jgi:hypothetical protein
MPHNPEWWPTLFGYVAQNEPDYSTPFAPRNATAVCLALDFLREWQPKSLDLPRDPLFAITKTMFTRHPRKTMMMFQTSPPPCYVCHA